METLQVRRKASLDRVIGTYRLVFLAISLLVVATAAVSLSDVFVFGPARALPTYLVVLRVVAAAELVGFLRWGYLRIRRDVREAADEQQQLLDSAHRDALTGAYLRSYFHELLKQQLLHRPEVPVGYLQVDMDQLKALNDAQGHAAGDAALRHIAGTIMRLAPQAVLGRLGGDEFGVALVGQDNKAELLRLGERILDEVREEVRVGERTIRISVTVGIAVTPGDAGDMTELMARADLALYRGKRSGRSMVVGYDHDMLVDERHQRFIQRELRAALLLGEIKVYYQPIFAPDGQTLLAYEALARWHHAHRGIIPPSQFIPVAEQSDIIDRLGEVVLQQVCADLGRLTAPVSINVSPVQLRRAGFAAGFAAILLDAGIAGNRIVVEITENVLMRAGGIESENLAALRQLGVRIAIDDLGTGHASLEYLRSFAFDIIKIDRSYTAHLLTSRVDRMIVSAICDIARAMDVEVIAEGVETQEQLEALRQLGCDAMQGYLFGRPAPLALLEPGRSIASAA